MSQQSQKSDAFQRLASHRIDKVSCYEMDAIKTLRERLDFFSEN